MRDQQAGSGSLAEVGTGLAADSRIAGYWLEEQIGQGGMAVVFRARDERLHRLVALKVLAPALAGDGESRQRFIRESRAAAAVDDPHIIPVFEAGETAAGALFIAMRFVPGGDVYSLVRRIGPLSAPRAAAIVSPVASALDAAHAAGLVHRDVKPANMLLDTRPGRPDHVYLSDFGLSKGTVSASTGSTGLTGAGHFMGTLDYISPERIEGHQADGRADQYALACSAFEMLTGAPPFRSPEAAALMYAQLSQPPPPLTSRRPDLPAAADQVFARALAKAPGDRYASCREFADALRAAFGLASYDSGPEPVLAVQRPPAAERRPAAEQPPAAERPPARPGPPPGTTFPAPSPRRPAPPRPFIPPRPLIPPRQLIPPRPIARPRPLVTPRLLPRSRPRRPPTPRRPFAPPRSDVPPPPAAGPPAARSWLRSPPSSSWPRRQPGPTSCTAGRPAGRRPRPRSPRPRHRTRSGCPAVIGTAPAASPRPATSARRLRLRCRPGARPSWSPERPATAAGPGPPPSPRGPSGGRPRTPASRSRPRAVPAPPGPPGRRRSGRSR